MCLYTNNYFSEYTFAQNSLRAHGVPVLNTMQTEIRGGSIMIFIIPCTPRPNLSQSSQLSSRIIVDLLSYERKTTDKREQYDWRAEKNWMVLYYP